LGVADFPDQPSWRNDAHQLIDIRLQESGQSVYYVFSYTPDLDPTIFEQVLASLQFDNDSQSFVAPIDRARERVTKKPFGLQVSPTNSPVSPERFSGWHTGVDFETFEDEADIVVPVRAFCSGTIRTHNKTSGYGGLIVQDCLYGSEPITVSYGHIANCSTVDTCIDAPVGTYVVAGDMIAVLGKGYSVDTDGERKHLHFGVVRGKKNEIRGYVSEEQQLKGWFDPLNAFFEVF